MLEELDILKIVADNPEITQRKIAEKAGISLGQVNFLIKKCAKKGLIKIEGQTTKSIKYNLTPKGIVEKAALTMEYVKVSYKAVITLSDKIRVLAEEYENKGKKLYVYGADNEMMDICKLALADRAEYVYMSSGADKITAGSVCFYWESQELDNNTMNDFEGEDNTVIWVNILN